VGGNVAPGEDMKNRLLHQGSVLVASTLLSLSAYSQVVATCSEPKGYAHYHHTELVPKKNSGFHEDKISGGLTTLQRLSKDEYDVLLVDARRQPMSMRNDGGRVLLLRKGTNDVTFLVAFPGKTIELYTFYRENDGQARFDLISSKGGDGMPIHKSSVMSGTCQHLDLSLIK
jgi:hypothetical protein